MDWLPPWPLIESELRTLMLPAFGAAALVLAATCAATKRAGVRLAGGALALIAGLVAGNHFHEMLEWWTLQSPPDETVERMPWWALVRDWNALLPVAAAAIVLGLLAALLPKRFLGVALRVLAAAGAAWWVAEAFPPLSKIAVTAALFAGIALNHEALLFTAGQTLPRTSLLVLTIPWCATAATVLIFAGSARMADLAGLMMAAVGGVGLFAALWRMDLRAFFAGPATYLPILILAGAGSTSSKVPLAAFVCAAFAPCALWLLCLPQIRRLPPRAIAALAVTAIAIPCAVAVALAVSHETLQYE